MQYNKYQSIVHEWMLQLNACTLSQLFFQINVNLIKCFWTIVLNQAPKSQYFNSRDLTFRQVNEIVILLMKAKKSVIVIDISCQEGGNWALC